MSFNDRDCVGMQDWVVPVCELPLRYREPGVGGIREIFAPAGSRLDDRATFIVTVGHWIDEHRYLADAWRAYSADKRSSPEPYFGLSSAPLVVVSSMGATWTIPRSRTRRMRAQTSSLAKHAGVLRRHRVQGTKTPPSADGAQT